MTKKQIRNLSDIELKREFNKRMSNVNRMWSGCHDGSYECAYHYEVEPLAKEMMRRNFPIPIVITDVFHRHVFAGQQVAVLVKEHKKYNPHTNLERATYLGKGRYGFEFKVHGLNYERVVCIRHPQVVKK